MSKQNTASTSSRLAFRGLCLQHGYNSLRLAEEIGIAPTVLSDRIRQRTPWRWHEVVAVCKALGIGLDEFARYYPG